MLQELKAIKFSIPKDQFCWDNPQEWSLDFIRQNRQNLHRLLMKQEKQTINKLQQLKKQLHEEYIQAAELRKCHTECESRLE